MGSSLFHPTKENRGCKDLDRLLQVEQMSDQETLPITKDPGLATKTGEIPVCNSLGSQHEILSHTLR